FIYTISSKGALKSLRARSLYIELLANHIPALILERLNLPPANLLFCGGAQFEILLPNNSQAEKVLQGIKEEVNEWLWENLGGKLYLALQWVPLSKEELVGEGLSLKRKQLFTLLEKDKRNKFSSVENLFQPIEVEAEECDVCKSPSEVLQQIEEGVRFCPLCYNLFKLGGEIAKMKNPCFIAHPQGEIRLPGASYKLIDKNDLSSYLLQAERLFLINAKPDDLPPHPCINFLPLARHAKLDKDGNLKDFDALAKSGMGAQRIGILQLDVDHLGLIFSKGLGKELSFSRLATLSRFLSLFFKVYIDDILKGKELAVVYSGGDDAFIVGAWSDVLESAFEIREKFSLFTQNPSFTISSGYVVCDEKEPL
ncbi:MAG: type III-A CRISPR-associated protein Cas10/Csm1, partial [bacterium]